MKFGEEHRASRNLVAQDFHTHVFEFRTLPNRLGVRKTVNLFEGWIFVQVRRGQDWRPIAHTRGVHQMMLGPEGEPVRVPDEDLQRFFDLEDELGYVRVEETEPPVFGLGQTVTAVLGFFMGARGVYVGPGSARNRARVAFQLFGKPIEQEVSVYHLA